MTMIQRTICFLVVAAPWRFAAASFSKTVREIGLDRNEPIEKHSVSEHRRLTTDTSVSVWKTSRIPGVDNDIHVDWKQIREHKRGEWIMMGCISAPIATALIIVDCVAQYTTETMFIHNMCIVGIIFFSVFASFAFYKALKYVF